MQSSKKNKSVSNKRLSLWRLFIAFVLLILITSGLVSSMKRWQIEGNQTSIDPWFASYVDVTATPYYNFEQLGSSKNPNVVLSFIVSSHEDPCIPSWGGYYSMEEAGQVLDLDRRIARLRQQDGHVAISFGGALNDELAVKCTDELLLQSAYESVIDRYNLDTIDLDIEGAGLTDQAALARRAHVIKKIQQDRRLSGKNLAVWLTLPVSPQGLTPDGTNAVSVMLETGVDLSGVNLMTMDYGDSKDPNDSMFVASKNALIQTHRQLGILYKQININLNSSSLWKKIGATPMIGQNDVVEEVFSHEDAINLNHFGLEQGIGRMSMWSANRDIPCGENYVNLQIVSDSCSGVKDPKSSFANTLGNGFDGDISQLSMIKTQEDPQDFDLQEPDDPNLSPYQIWSENGAYLQGTKVVWHRNVYQAKWWTKGDLPDNPVLQSWETPWQLIGPVLPGEVPIPQPTLAPGTYGNWSGTVEYQTGDRVLFDGFAFEAKWWNQGQSPAAAASNADSSPWVLLTQAEIEALLQESSASAKSSKL